jgi:hypothetical protein
MEPKPDLKPATPEESLVATIVLAGVGLVLLAFSPWNFLHLHTATGMKFLGFCSWAFGCCFDPVNCLWLWLPFTSHEIVQSPKYARYIGPFVVIGFICIAIGWYGDGWLIEPPKKP